MRREEGEGAGRREGLVCGKVGVRVFVCRLIVSNKGKELHSNMHHFKTMTDTTCQGSKEVRPTNQRRRTEKPRASTNPPSISLCEQQRKGTLWEAVHHSRRLQPSITTTASPCTDAIVAPPSQSGSSMDVFVLDWQNGGNPRLHSDVHASAISFLNDGISRNEQNLVVFVCEASL